MALVYDLASYSVMETFKRKIRDGSDALDVFVWYIRIARAARHKYILSDLVLDLQKSSALHRWTRVVVVDDQGASPGPED